MAAKCSIEGLCFYLKTSLDEKLEREMRFNWQSLSDVHAVAGPLGSL